MNLPAIFILLLALVSTSKAQVLLSGRRVSIPTPSSYSAPFSPTDISGCKLWVRASDSSGVNGSVYTDAAKTTLAVNGNTVDTWADISGNGYDHKVSTHGNGPVFTTNVVNGLPALAFNGDYPVVSTTFAQLFNGSNKPWTAVAFAKRTSGDRAHFCLSSTTGAGVHFLSTSGAAYRDYRHDDATGAVDLTGGTPNTSFCLLMADFTGTAMTYYISNTSTKAIDAAQSVGSVTFDRSFIGCRFISASISQVFLGYIAEVIVYDTALSTSDLGKLITYATTKYGAF